jgi:hypothetical protein
MKMKKALFAAFLLALPAMAGAKEARGQKPEGFGGGKNGGFMEQLTEEQKSCIEKQGCPKREMKKPDGEFKPGEKPQKKEMSAEEKAAMETERACQKKAFETCGIQMPERPEGMPHGGKPHQ